MLFGHAQRAVVVVELGYDVVASSIVGQVVDVSQLVELFIDQAGDHVALGAVEAQVVFDVLDQRLGILAQQRVSLFGCSFISERRGGVIGLKERVGVRIREADLRRRKPFKAQVEQLDGLLDAVLPEQLLGYRGERLAAVRGRQMVLREEIDVDVRIGKVAVAERVAQQRGGVVGIDPSDLIGVVHGRQDRHEAVGVSVELEVVQQAEALEDVDLREVDRAFPVEVGEHVEQHQFVLLQRVSLEVEVDRVHHQVAVLFGHDARGDGVLLVHRQGDPPHGDIVHH